MATYDNTFTKEERITSETLVNKLFEKGNKSVSVYPLYAVFMSTKGENVLVPASILISVPKKRFHHAVDRNRVKRQIREAYRLNKQPLINVLQEKGISMAIAFIFTDNKLYSSHNLSKRMQELLTKIAEAVAQ